MLLTQHIKLYWDKKCRGGQGAEERNHMSQAALLPEHFFDYIPFGVPSHFQMISQKADGFHIKINHRNILTLGHKNCVHMDPIELIPAGSDGYEIYYRYILHHSAKPKRLKYNKDMSRFVGLEEFVFTLMPGEYGRTLCNGRFVDIDTGNWWYEIDIANIMLWIGEQPPLDCFLQREPDKLYKQIERLY